MAAEARAVSAAPEEPLWRPTVARIAAAPITRYRAWLQARHGLEFPAVNVDSMANPGIIDWFVAFQAARP